MKLKCPWCESEAIKPKASRMDVLAGKFDVLVKCLTCGQRATIDFKATKIRKEVK